MKKLSVLLVVLLMLSMLAGCKNEGGTPNVQIPGYQIKLALGSDWTEVEKPDDTNLEEGQSPIISRFDLEMEKKGMKLLALGFAPQDFVDLPIADDLFIDCNDTLQTVITDLSEVTAPSSYEKNGKQIISAMFSGNENGETKRIYCFQVDFGADTYCQAWIAFIAKEADMNKNKDAFKAIVEGAVCSAEPYDFESGMDDELYFDEDGNLITDDTEPEEIIYDTEPVSQESNPTEPSVDATVSTTAPAETTAATEASAPAATTAPAETTAAAETTTAATQAQ